MFKKKQVDQVIAMFAQPKWWTWFNSSTYASIGQRKYVMHTFKETIIENLPKRQIEEYELEIIPTRKSYKGLIHKQTTTYTCPVCRDGIVGGWCYCGKSNDPRHIFAYKSHEKRASNLYYDALATFCSCIK